MNAILNESLWDDLLNFDELINDFHFSEKLSDNIHFEEYELRNHD